MIKFRRWIIVREILASISVAVWAEWWGHSATRRLIKLAGKVPGEADE